jgi:hypothetical protein
MQPSTKSATSLFRRKPTASAGCRIVLGVEPLEARYTPDAYLFQSQFGSHDWFSASRSYRGRSSFPCRLRNELRPLLPPATRRSFAR